MGVIGTRHFQRLAEYGTLHFFKVLQIVRKQTFLLGVEVFVFGINFYGIFQKIPPLQKAKNGLKGGVFEVKPPDTTKKAVLQRLCKKR